MCVVSDKRPFDVRPIRFRRRWPRHQFNGLDVREVLLKLLAEFRMLGNKYCRRNRLAAVPPLVQFNDQVVELIVVRYRIVVRWILHEVRPRLLA